MKNMFFRKNTNSIIPFLITIFCIGIVFSLWSNATLEPKKSPDTYGYLAVAEDLFHYAASYRPPVYPLFLKFNMILFDEHWEQMAMFFQIVLHSLSTILVFLMFRSFFSPLISFITSLCICCNPSLVFYSTYMLPESILGFFITLTCFFSIKLITLDSNNSLIKYKYSIGIGIASGIAALTKPIWSLGIIPIIFSYLFFHYRYKTTLIVITLALFFHFLFPISWKVLKNKHGVIGEKQYLPTIAVCLASLRAGLIDYGIDTPLYTYIEEKGLLSKAQNMSGKDDENFRSVYNSLTQKSRYDTEFAKAIINKAPFKFIIAQLSQWRYFFTNRMFFPGEGSFSGMPDMVRYLYYGGYNWLYRPFLSLLLCSAILLGIIKKEYRKIN